MTETQKNLRTFCQMTNRALVDYQTKRFLKDQANHDEARIDRERLDVTRVILEYSLGDYEVGEPTREDSERHGPVVTAGMSVHGMNGIIMFRDGEVTSHT